MAADSCAANGAGPAKNRDRPASPKPRRAAPAKTSTLLAPPNRDRAALDRASTCPAPVCIRSRPRAAARRCVAYLPSLPPDRMHENARSQPGVSGPAHRRDDLVAGSGSPRRRTSDRSPCADHRVPPPTVALRGAVRYSGVRHTLGRLLAIQRSACSSSVAASHAIFVLPEHFRQTPVRVVAARPGLGAAVLAQAAGAACRQRQPALAHLDASAQLRPHAASWHSICGLQTEVARRARGRDLHQCVGQHEVERGERAGGRQDSSRQLRAVLSSSNGATAFIGPADRPHATSDRDQQHRGWC